MVVVFHLQQSNLVKMVLSIDRWIGKVAIVTGASSGIGAAIARKLVEEGLIVVGLARRIEIIEQNAKKLQNKKGKLHAFKADISKEEDILKAFKWVTEIFGPVHILINNAGIAHRTTLAQGETEKWKAVLDTNVLGLCIATREAVKIMKKNQIDGHIVHINSISGHRIPGIPNLNVYAAAKHAVTALTETLRQEFNIEGLRIKVTSISPGVVATPFIKKIDSDESASEESLTIPFLKAEDISDAVVYVISTPPHVQVHELMIKPMGEDL